MTFSYTTKVKAHAGVTLKKTEQKQTIRTTTNECAEGRDLDDPGDFFATCTPYCERYLFFFVLCLFFVYCLVFGVVCLLGLGLGLAEV